MISSRHWQFYSLTFPYLFTSIFLKKVSRERCGQCSKHVLSPAFLPAHCKGTIFANTLVKCREEWLSNEKIHNDNLKESPPEMARKGLWGPFSVWGMWNSKSVRHCLIRVHRKDLRKVFTQISLKCWRVCPWAKQIWWLHFLMYRSESECKHFQALDVVAIFEKELDQRHFMPVSGHQTGSVTPQCWENKTRQRVKEEQTLNFISAFLSILQARTWQLEKENRNWVSISLTLFYFFTSFSSIPLSIQRQNCDSLNLVHSPGLIAWL